LKPKGPSRDCIHIITRYHDTEHRISPWGLGMGFVLDRAWRDSVELL
jgi:hypothetical protein